MVTTKILVTITSDDEPDIEEYVDAIEEACREVEGRPMIAGETKISVTAVADGKES